MIVMSVVALLLMGSNSTVTVSSATLTPTSTPVCRKTATIKTDHIVFADSGENHRVIVYLPPCYADDATYPVLYWSAVFWQGIIDHADSLIRRGDTPPFIIISVDIDVTKGYGANRQIADYVVPYMESHYHTKPDRLHRSITGVSHGAAIAVRTAFGSPDIFGRVLVISGGIADTELTKFTNWISAMQPDQQPTVRIDVGDKDGISAITRNLTGLLDKLKFPYTFTSGAGDHDSTYWDAHMSDYLMWLMPKN